MTTYEDTLSMEDARRRYFDDNHFGADGGYQARWVKVKLGPLAMFVPNTEARRRAVRFHDLHHVLTGYQTDLKGEAEIGAWELGSGCARHYVAWILNLSAMSLRLLCWSRATFRAFVRGRRSDNFYRSQFSDELLRPAVGELRRRLRISPPDERPASAGEIGAFLACSALAMPTGLLEALLSPLLLPFALLRPNGAASGNPPGLAGRS